MQLNNDWFFINKHLAEGEYLMALNKRNKSY